jgi:hypothetical protein
MLDAEEHPGIFTFLVGMIVLVMVAVGFSLLIDKRFKFSSGLGEIRREIESDAADLAELKTRLEDRSARFSGSEVALKKDARENADLRAAATVLARREDLLRQKVADLRASVKSVESQFADYRTRYRTRTWSRAVGEKLGTVNVRGGREFKDSVITKVTDVGLEIRHEHGIARIQAPDLDRPLQDRFQWDDEERRRRLQQEEELLHGKPPEPPPAEELEVVEAVPAEPVSRRPARTKPVVDPATEEKIRELRQQLSGWKMRVARIRGEKRQAASNAGYGGSKSVPGSLETWKSRELRLGRELIKAQTELEMVRAKLMAESPNDPVLRMMEEQER